MNRRKFIKSFNAGVGGILLLSNSYFACSPAANERKIKNWLWLRPLNDFSADDYKSYFEKIKKAGIDAILPEIYNSWEARFKSTRLPNSTEWLEQILPLAKSAGLEVHAWMWSMICNIKEINEKHPDWFGVNGRGEPSVTDPAYVDYYKFMCPNHPEVQEFVKANVSELASYSEVDGVHLDYIRFPDVILAESLQPKYNIVQDKEYPEYDYCYCERCVSQFKEETGVDIRKEQDPSQNKEWLQFRYNSITSLVNKKLIPAARDKGKLVTAAVFPNWQHVRQNWAEWELDAVLPMLYHEFYNKGIDWIHDKTSDGVKSLKHKTDLYSGLFIPALKPEKVASAIDVSLKAGAAGVSLFSAGDMTEKHWEVFSKYIKDSTR